MNIYLSLLLVALVAIYVVDVSGFTTSWRSQLARWLGTTEEHLRPLPPFDCGKCATFWACCGYALAVGEFSLPVLAFACGLSLLSFPIGQAMIFLRETLTRWIPL